MSIEFTWLAARELSALARINHGINNLPRTRLPRKSSVSSLSFSRTLSGTLEKYTDHEAEDTRSCSHGRAPLRIHRARAPVSVDHSHQSLTNMTCQPFVVKKGATRVPGSAANAWSSNVFTIAPPAKVGSMHARAISTGNSSGNGGLEAYSNLFTHVET